MLIVRIWFLWCCIHIQMELVVEIVRTGIK
jgi:hypothetical protein